MSTIWSRLKLRLQREMADRLARRPLSLGNSQPLVSFTFDDFPRSALHCGGAILRSQGLTGTFYASFGLMGGTAPTGQIFVEDDLIELIEEQHELGCHTFDHCHSWITAPSVFKASIIRNRAALAAHFRKCASGHFLIRSVFHGRERNGKLVSALIVAGAVGRTLMPELSIELT